ncbi:hypothetical protein NKG94_31715 [Micromonospora sp. M12]
MEDARFVRFVDESGPVYRATYTAYDGRNIATRALASDDLRRFEMTPMRGPGARNKGLALFPRTVGGRHLALCRADGETIGLTALDGESRWQARPVARTERELGVDPGRQLRLTDRDRRRLARPHPRCRADAPVRDRCAPARPAPARAGRRAPARCVSRTRGDDRDGYVPNVVYSCGALVHDGELWMPYGASDARVGFATVRMSALLGTMVEVPPSGDRDG